MFAISKVDARAFGYRDRLAEDIKQSLRAFSRAVGVAVLIACCVLRVSSAYAESVDYTYDALGRLTTVSKSDGTQTIYMLDAAGNRTEVREGVAPSAPPAITVPSSSATGNYPIAWTASTSGTVENYELYESTTSSFSAQTRVYRGTARSRSISGKSDGTYYYRVRACSVSCSAYTSGANGVAVTVPPLAPGEITLVATTNTGTYPVRWGTVSGTVTYEAEESPNSGFAGATRVYAGTQTSFVVSAHADGTFYYRARACKGTVCGPYTAAKSVFVAKPPSAPGAASAPSPNGTGSYTVRWAAPSSGTITNYEVYEISLSDVTVAVLVYNGSASEFSVNGRGNGSYQYNVRACNGANNCSSTTLGSTVVVTLPPSPTSVVRVQASSLTGNYVISWEPVTGQLTRYELWEATNSGFTGEVRVTNANVTLQNITNKTDGSYYYRVRACNGDFCSAYVAGSQPIVVIMPGGAPPAPSGLSASPSNICEWVARWTVSTGATRYELLDYSGQIPLSVSTNSATFTYCTVPAYSGNPDDYRPKWVRACNANGCSIKTDFRY